ncbi:MAG: energy-coupling factor transporter transmembrane component T [Bacillota bacterium]
MPEWLQLEEKYAVPSERDSFINKSILAFLSVISRIRAQEGANADQFFVNSVFKVFFTLSLAILTSLSSSFTFVIVIIVYLLVILSFMDADQIIKILRISLLMTVFSFVILLPAVFWGNSYSIVMITSKVFVTVTSVNILSHSTSWTSISSALKRFFVPDIFIFVIDITIKYIVMLGEFSLHMLYALKLRSVGKNKSKYLSLSGIAGTMFVKSKEMAEDMYSAMECRGFSGDYRIYVKFKFTFADFVYIIINVGIIFAFAYLGRA